MEKEGKYIYGVINSNTSFRLFTPVDSKHLTEFTPECSEAQTKTNGVYPVRNSIENSKDSKISNGVYTVPCREFGAVVCDSVIVDCRRLPKETLAKQLLTHQKVIEKIMGSGVTVIPVKLGTYAFDDEEVKLILDKGYNLIKEIADKINEKIEIDLVASWADFKLVLKQAGEDKEIKEFKEKLLSSGRKITADDQMKAGYMLKKAMDRKNNECVDKIQERLEDISEGAKRHEVMDDKMIANCAFLMDKAKKDEFYKRIECLDGEFGGEINFKCVGPLPAYSFYTLEIKRMRFNDIDSARKKLGILNEQVSEDDIKKAYQRQAIAFHPDKNQGREEEANIEFGRIKDSYNVLLEYASACRQASESRLAFSEAEFKKNELLIKVKDGKDW
ncbi:MAG: GvpL/GvpF family gas vesicle protein [Candidatus Omnitrophica bacterium]|nr:GvpL/GvpF family gas vesicle protein [Candidatus Omnitrophota bacterium]